MAILARVPESMASMRCEMGWPISIFTPGSTLSFSRMSARTSSLERSLRTKGTSISDTLTPSACSSSSARPVLRPTVCTSGTESRISSAIRPILSLSSSDMPGRVLTLMVNDPSLNGGRKLRPRVKKTISAATSTPPVISNTFFVLPRDHCRACPYQPFSFLATMGSFSGESSFFLLASK